MANLTELQLLLDLSKSILGISDINEVLAIAIDKAIEITNAERGIIMLFEKKDNILFQTARNLQKQDLNHPEFEISRTIINKVKKNGKLFYRDNALKDQELKKSASTMRLNILSVICLPLIYNNEIFGVVYLDNRTFDGVFSIQTCQFAQSFSDFISLAAFQALERKRLQNQVSSLEKKLRYQYQFEAIIGHHPKIVQILKLISQVADSETTILIQGESGTGKELVAFSLHNNSDRKDKPFVPINCGALPENLLESELFGHVKGAFTGAITDKIGWFEKANKGTIFLDEIAEMSPSLQVKLLRLLQSGEYSKVGSTQVSFCNVRVIAATNKDLRKLVDQGKFRDDLYYRINVITIDLPALRERKDDIPLLVQHFLKKFNMATNKNIKSLSQDAERILSNYDFPGNVRELENIIQRAVVLAEDQTIEPWHFPTDVNTKIITSETEKQTAPFKIAKQQMIENFERKHLIKYLKESRGNISKAAKMAGIHFKNFHAKIEKYGINANDYKL